VIRTIWFTLNVIVMTTGYGIAAIVAGLLKVPNREGGVYDRIIRGWCQSLLRASGATVDVRGLENIPKDTPVVFVSNHQSWFDIFILAAHLPGHIRFVAKKELTKIPFLGGAMKAADQIFIDRHNRQAAFEAYATAAETIRSGVNAIVFPEGTRSRTGELQPFKKGPFVLAIASQVPVVPVYCAGTFTLLPKGSLRVNPHPVAALIGKPMPTEGLTYEDREAFLTDVRAAVIELRTEGRALLGMEETDGRGDRRSDVGR